MKNLFNKIIATGILGAGLVLGGNAYSQNTIEKSDTTKQYNEQGQLIKEVVIQNNKKYTWNYVYNDKGELADIKGFREVSNNDKLYFDSYIKEDGKIIEGHLKNGPGIREK